MARERPIGLFEREERGVAVSGAPGSGGEVIPALDSPELSWVPEGQSRSFHGDVKSVKVTGSTTVNCNGSYSVSYPGGDGGGGGDPE